MAQYTVTIEPKTPEGAGCGGCLGVIYIIGFVATLGLWIVGASHTPGSNIIGGLVMAALWPLVWAYAILSGMI